MPVSSVTEHWIKQDAIIINLNHFGDPDYLQVSVLAGAVVMAFKQDVIGYNAARNYRTWPLQAANTFFETTDALNVYARLTRSEVNASALIIYDPLLRDIEGRSISYADDGSEVLGEADEEYYYIYLGQISSSLDSNGNEIGREWSVDFRFGNLDTNQYRNEDGGGEWTKMFRLNKVTDMIDVLKTFSSAIFKKIFIGNKGVTDIKRSSDTDKDVPVSDESLTTSKYVNDKFLNKDKDDRSKGQISSDKGFEAGKFVQEATGAACYQDKDGNWHIETDHLRVRKKAVFTEIEVQEVHHVGGQMMLTAANMIVDYVFDMEDRYRCYFLKKDTDGREVENLWQTGDQAYCNTFNLEKQEDGTLGNHYLWRLVVATNLDTADDAETRTFGDVTIQTADYNFVDLSKEACAVNSDAPKANDEIVQLGYQPSDDSNRQNAILMAGAGSGSPYIYEFTGINSFTLPEPETRIKPGDNFFTGIMRIQGGSTGAANLSDFPDEVFKSVHIGAVNLLLNSGFTGDYESEELSSNYKLQIDSELYSKALKHWNGIATISDDAAAVSGRCVELGSLSQSVKLINGESYVISFKAKGGNIAITCGNYSVSQPLSADYQRYQFKFVSNGSGSFLISGEAKVCDLQLERGTIATDWNPSPYDNDKAMAAFQALKYMQDAIKEGDTTILGGLILSSMIQLGNYKDGKMEKVNAGMSGIYSDDDDVAFWGGGTYEQAIRTITKFKQNPHYMPTEEEWKGLANFVVSHGGDAFYRGYIYALGGYFRGMVDIANGKIRLNEDGSGHFANGTLEWTKEGFMYRHSPETIKWIRIIHEFVEDYIIKFDNGLYFDIGTGVGDDPYILPDADLDDLRIGLKWDFTTRSSAGATLQGKFTVRVPNNDGSSMNRYQSVDVDYITTIGEPIELYWSYGRWHTDGYATLNGDIATLYPANYKVGLTKDIILDGHTLKFENGLLIEYN